MIFDSVSPAKHVKTAPPAEPTALSIKTSVLDAKVLERSLKTFCQMIKCHYHLNYKAVNADAV